MEVSCGGDSGGGGSSGGDNSRGLVEGSDRIDRDGGESGGGDSGEGENGGDICANDSSGDNTKEACSD